MQELEWRMEFLSVGGESGGCVCNEGSVGVAGEREYRVNKGTGNVRVGGQEMTILWGMGEP